jgi:hypothetical protein
MHRVGLACVRREYGDAPLPPGSAFCAVGVSDGDDRTGDGLGEPAMFRWHLRGWRLRTGVVAAGVALLLVLLAEIHACACTGGSPVWRSVYRTSGG